MLATTSVSANEANAALMGIRYATAIPGSAPQVVKEFHPNDVLLGRGSPIVNYEGNVRFREIVATRRNDYVGTLCHQRKDDIAREIVVSVAQLHGRFLRRLETKEETERLGLAWGEKVWVLADEDVAIEKVKQALRDKIVDNKNKPASDVTNDSVPSEMNIRKGKKKRKQPPTSSSELQSGAANMRQVASRISSSLPAPALQRHTTPPPPPTVPEPPTTSLLDTTAPHLSPIALLLQQEERNRQQLSQVNQQRIGLHHLGMIRQAQQHQQNMLRQQIPPTDMPQLSIHPLHLLASSSPAPVPSALLSRTMNVSGLSQNSATQLETLQALEALLAEQEERSRQAAALSLLRELQQRRQQQEELLVLQQQLRLERTREALSNSFGPNTAIHSNLPQTFIASAAPTTSNDSLLIPPSSNTQADTSLILALLQYQQLNSSGSSPGELPTVDCLATSEFSATMPPSSLLPQATTTPQPTLTHPKESAGSSVSSSSSNLSSADDGKPAAK